MTNIVLEDKETKRYSAWKRGLSFFIDGILTVGMMLFLLLFVSDFSIRYFAKDSIEQINEVYASVCTEKNYPYHDNGAYGIYQLDLEQFITQRKDEGLTTKDAFDKYQIAYDEVDKEVSKTDSVLLPYQNINRIYLLHEFVSIFISAFVFELLVPLLNKKHKTIGMFITKSCLVTKDDHIVISNTKVFLRFFFIFVLELLTVFLVLNYFGLLFLGIGTFAMISFTKNRLTFHDAIIKSKIIEDNRAYLE